MATQLVTLSSKDIGHVGKFNGTNFPFWKFQICLVFKTYNLFNIVMGAEPKPNPVIVTDAAGNNSSNEDEIEAWCHRDNLAQVVIVSTLEEVWQRSLINCRSSNEMWKRLTCQHEQAAEENKHQLLQSFYEYKYQPTHNVMSHNVKCWHDNLQMLAHR